MKLRNRAAVKHHEFQSLMVGKYPLTFIFERKAFQDPTESEMECWARRKAIVEANGGVMLEDPYTKKPNPRYTRKDCEAMNAAVLEANPDLRIAETWNGVGYYGYSIGCYEPKGNK